MMETRIWYKLKELIKTLRASTEIVNGDYYRLYTLLYVAIVSNNNSDRGYLYNILTANGIDEAHLKGFIVVDGESIIDTDALAQLVGNILNKYENEYVAHATSEATFLFDNTSQYLPEVFRSESMENFAYQFVNILTATYPKYYKILNIYKDNESHLLDKLSKISNGKKTDNYTIESSGKTIGNSIPNSVDVVATMEDNQYASDLAKSEGTTSNSGTSSTNLGESYDSKYLIEKINDIQEAYRMTLREWAEEFHELFIEEGNIL